MELLARLIETKIQTFAIYLIMFVFPSNATITFSQENFAVGLSPQISLADISSYPDHFRKAALRCMLETISSKFSKIASIYRPTAEPKFSSLESFSKLIPTSAAEFNRILVSSGKVPLEVILLIELHSLTSALSEIDNIKDLADQANTIHSSTVKQIMLTFTNFAELHEMAKFMEYAHTKIATNYTLGLISTFKHFPLVQALLTNYTSLQIVALYGITNSQDFVNGAFPTASKIIQEFQKYKEIISTWDANVTVQYASVWSDTNANSSEDGYDTVTQNMSSLITFWETMNKWAEEENSLVIMFSAFDIPRDNLKPLGHLGWWKLSEESFYKNASEYVFIEKWQLVYNATTKEEKTLVSLRDSESNDALPVISIVVASTSLLLILLCAVFVFGLTKRFKKRSRHTQYLTQTELDDFFHGKGSIRSRASRATFNDQDDKSVTNSVVDLIPYEKNLELSNNNFIIDYDTRLGRGEFGVVYKGIVETRPGERLEVAVKTTKKRCSQLAFKSFLSEIKLMSYLGQQENVVNIIGAYTKEISQGKLFIFLELCPSGSLYNYLHGMRPPDYENLLVQNDHSVDTEDHMYMNIAVDKNLSQVQMKFLHRWSHEIASGLAYLASKCVVHADIATRNVLLTFDLTAKISDFGLSRRLYEYQDYVKKSKEPLPWRWMAPESLRSLIFNEKTDVWAFGVTLWEIYSLGEQPYPNCGWTSSYRKKLESGLRLGKPRYDDGTIHSIILECCAANPVNRPNFSSLKATLTMQ